MNQAEPAEVANAREAWLTARAEVEAADEAGAPNEIWGPLAAREAELDAAYRDAQERAFAAATED